MLAAAVALGVALLVLAPVELVRAYEAVVLFSGMLGSNAAFPLFQSEQDLAIVLGGASQFSLAPFAAGLTTGELWPCSRCCSGAAAVVAAIWTMERMERRAVARSASASGGSRSSPTSSTSSATTTAMAPTRR